MGRKNNRDTRHTFEPDDLTPANVAEIQRISKQRIYSSPEARRERERLEAERRLQQDTARANRGIDWSICLVPGCGQDIPVVLAAELRDHNTRLPLCYKHLAVAHVQATRFANNELLVAAAASVIATKAQADAEHEDAAKKAWLARTDGFMYFIRLNGLIKVGWTRSLEDRLRAYGPSAEVLAHYPATRPDETNLHRQLRPFLAKGREWYQECKALDDFVQQAIEKHGPPTVTAVWTEPKEVIKLRRRSA